MHSLGQYKHFWRGVPDFKGQGQGQVKVKGQNGVVLSFKLAVYLYYALCSVVSAELTQLSWKSV